MLLMQEIIQNAEDAGATQVKFLYDKNSFGTARLYNEELAQFQVQINFFLTFGLHLSFSLRTVPPFVTAHLFCASWDVHVS